MLCELKGVVTADWLADKNIVLIISHEVLLSNSMRETVFLEFFEPFLSVVELHALPYYLFLLNTALKHTQAHYACLTEVNGNPKNGCSCTVFVCVVYLLPW